jgi:hypothetical protein
MSGDPHVRFGGRGHRTQSMLPTPIHPPNPLGAPRVRWTPRSSVGSCVDGNIPRGRRRPNHDGRFTLHIESPMQPLIAKYVAKVPQLSAIQLD